MTPRIFIDGEAGTTGLGIRDRLRALPVRLLSVDPDRRRDPEARCAAMRDAELVVLCLPDHAAREAAAMVAGLPHPPGVRDASTAFRSASDWVYGFPQLGAAQPGAIAAAPRVSNPGCYATGAVALLRPLVEAGLLPVDHPLSINAVSGYSGGGRAMIEAYEGAGGPAFRLYGLGLEHKHVPEIAAHARLASRPIFVPSVVHALRRCLLDWYGGSGRVSVSEGDADLADGSLVAEALVAEGLAGTDRMELAVHGSGAYPHALLTARLDNLGKGASGAAIENVALMLGLGS